MRAVEILASEQLATFAAGRTPLPANWASRALYTGASGAVRWLDLVHEPSYPLRDPHTFGLLEMRFAALDGLTVESFVSLGPGDGELDLALAASLQGARQRAGLKYIPVDLSSGLLKATIAHLESVVEIPVALQCDFETDHRFLRGALRPYAPCPRLFCLLGGTLGNLDLGEASFFQGLREVLDQGDYFLLDVPLAGPGWSAADEPRLKPQAYTTAFRRFLGVAPDAAFEQQVALTQHRDEQTGAEVITVSQRAAERPLLLFRRYRWQPILGWLREQGFDMRFALASLTGDQDKFGMGVVLLFRS